MLMGIFKVQKFYLIYIMRSIFKIFVNFWLFREHKQILVVTWVLPSKSILLFPQQYEFLHAAKKNLWF